MPITRMPDCASGHTAVPPAAPSPTTTTSASLSFVAMSGPPRRVLEELVGVGRLHVLLGNGVQLLILLRDDQARAGEAHELPAALADVAAVHRVAEHALERVRPQH